MGCMFECIFDGSCIFMICGGWRSFVQALLRSSDWIYGVRDGLAWGLYRKAKLDTIFSGVGNF
jgi:hypothetical protein